MTEEVRGPRSDVDDPLDRLIGQVDIAFVIDSTASMGPYISAARQHARREADRIAQSGELDVRFAVVAYRDHPPQDSTFVTRVSDFGDGARLDAALREVIPGGGGDGAEAVWDGVEAATRLSWRPNADRLVFLIGDAPPHGYGSSSDGFPAGCPCQNTAASVVEACKTARVKVWAHSIAGDPDTTRAFGEVAEPTGGVTTVVERPEESVRAFSGTMASTAGVVDGARTFSRIRRAMPASAPDSLIASTVTQSTGRAWTENDVTATRSYLTNRGIDVTGTSAIDPLATVDLIDSLKPEDSE
jgi:hypothetical protein